MKSQRGFLFGLEGLAMHLVVGLAVALALSWAGAGLGFWILDGKLEKANKTIQEQSEQLGKETSSRQAFEAAAGACTASIEGLEREADRKVKAAEARAAASQAATATAQTTIREILTRPRPAGMNECDAMKKELDDEIDRRRNPRP